MSVSEQNSALSITDSTATQQQFIISDDKVKINKSEIYHEDYTALNDWLI